MLIDIFIKNEISAEVYLEQSRKAENNYGEDYRRKQTRPILGFGPT